MSTEGEIARQRIERSGPVTVGAADGRTLFLWPFELSKSAGLKVLHWLGQEHASYALGLFAPEAAGLAADDLTRLLGAVAHHTGAAAAILKAQQALEASARPEREEARRRRIPRLWLG